jgi:hypothetical protein
MSFKNRMKEILCVIFGHDWSEYGSRTHENGRILEEYSKCQCCGLENHDRQGMLDQYEEEFGG